MIDQISRKTWSLTWIWAALASVVACSESSGQSVPDAGADRTSGSGASGADSTTSSGGGSTSGSSGGSTGGSSSGTVDGGIGSSSGGVSDSGAMDAGGSASDADASNETMELVHYYGRWNRSASRAITVNSGSHVVAQFVGTGVSATFDTTLNQAPPPTLAWRIDQSPWQEGELAPTVVLGAGLSGGTHQVTLLVRGLDQGQSRWSPPLVSSITFLGFDVPDGGAIEPSPRPNVPQIEFLGDSITEGCTVWTSFNGQTSICWCADALTSYVANTAWALGAEWRQVGFAAQGLLSKGNGGVPVANDTFNWIYESVPRDDWQPDMVVINQGTNDWPYSSQEFQPAYATFLATIRAAYPAAKIVAMRPFNGTHGMDIQSEVEMQQDGGDARLYFVDTTGWLDSSDYTDGTHPNPQGSQKATTALAAAIKAIGLP